MKNLSLPLAIVSALEVLPVVAQEKAAQEKIEEVVVIASRVETPLREVGASVSLIDREEIQLRGYPTVAQLLRTQPGIAVSNTGGAGKQTALRIRGEEAYRTLILIDGVEVSDPTATQVMPQVENLAMGSEIERVEILRGPQGFIYGADAGGVVQIFTQIPEAGAQGQLGLEGGRYGSQRFNGFFAAGHEKIDAFVSASDWSTDGFNTAVADQVGDKDGYSNVTVHGKLGWQPMPKLRAQLVLRNISAENAYDACFGSHGCESLFDQTTGKASIDYGGEYQSHHFAVARTDVEREHLSNGRSSFVTKGGIEKLEYVGRTQIAEGVFLVAGGDSKKEHVDVVADKDLENEQLGIFGEAQSGFGERVFLSAGARYDDNDGFGEYWSGRVSSAYLFTVNTGAFVKVRGSAGNGFRAPSVQEIAHNKKYGFGDAVKMPLHEETSSGYDFGLEYFRDSGISFQMTWFEQSVDDEIFWDRIKNSGYLQADGRSHSKGVELQLTLPMSHWAQLEANFTRNLTQTAQDLPRMRRPGKLANLSLNLHPMENLVLLLSNRWERDAVDGANREPLDNYEVLDISLTYKVLQEWELFGRVENTLDEKYQEVPGYNTSGRAAYLGTRFSF